MRVAIIGSRNANNLNLKKMIQRIPQNCSEIVSGGAVGVDAAAKEIAQLLKITYTEFPPQYDLYGQQAPMVRNGQIVDRADLVLAFWDLASRGTASTLNLCIQKRVPFRIYPLREYELPLEEELPL